MAAAELERAEKRGDLLAYGMAYVNTLTLRTRARACRKAAETDHE